jgi:hypothetical protein
VALLLMHVGDAALVHSGCERLRNLLHLGQDSGDSQSSGRSDAESTQRGQDAIVAAGGAAALVAAMRAHKGAQQQVQPPSLSRDRRKGVGRGAARWAEKRPFLRGQQGAGRGGAGR